MTPKIAGAVFLGVIAAFLAIKAPGWIGHAYQQAKYAKAFGITTSLTPDIVIERCGKPDADVSSRLPDLRLIYFKSHQPGTAGVTLEFAPLEDGRWLFEDLYTHGEPPRRLIGKEGPYVPDGMPVQNEDIYKRAYWQILELPCLDSAK